ncbi:hypothetical protein TIFTF001_022796 [Ficus carica]|uniref:Uncharacterized protein n=1 Tax=Ficus carica TaxID=3494 RepID=A0AA88DEV4_FICCA|nr:hypothetical protein TIFTF001_022796 [Ficus carica]
MVLLVAKINKLYSKLENLHHGRSSSSSSSSEEANLSGSLEGFLSDVSNSLSKFSTSSKTTSFPWIHECLELIPTANNAFAKLVVAIDHPATKWEASSMEEYLNFTLVLLDLFNSISSSLSHLGHAKLSLSHGLNTLALKHLKPIDPISLNKELLRREKARERKEEEGKGGSCTSKEEVIHKGIMVMESLGFWVCGVVLSCLCGACDEMRKFGGGFVKDSIDELDSRAFSGVTSKLLIELKEVKEVNEAADCLVAAIGDGGIGSGGEAEELRRRLEVLEKGLEGFRKEVDCLFMEVLSARNQLLHGFRHIKE